MFYSEDFCDFSEPWFHETGVYALRFTQELLVDWNKYVSSDWSPWEQGHFLLSGVQAHFITRVCLSQFWGGRSGHWFLRTRRCSKELGSVGTPVGQLQRWLVYWLRPGGIWKWAKMASLQRKWFSIACLRMAECYPYLALGQKGIWQRGTLCLKERKKKERDKDIETEKEIRGRDALIILRT